MGRHSEHRTRIAGNRREMRDNERRVRRAAGYRARAGQVHVELRYDSNATDERQ